MIKIKEKISKKIKYFFFLDFRKTEKKSKRSRWHIKTKIVFLINAYTISGSISRWSHRFYCRIANLFKKANRFPSIYLYIDNLMKKWLVLKSIFCDFLFLLLVCFLAKIIRQLAIILWWEKNWQSANFIFLKSNILLYRKLHL